MNVLIVEDVVPEAFLLAALVKGASNRVEIAHTMRDAWRWLNGKNGFDVVVLDLLLPDSTREMTMDSIPKIKESGRKVVVVTGRLTPEIQRIAMSSGADGCVYKGKPENRARTVHERGKEVGCPIAGAP